MTTLTARPYTGEADLPLIADLINACEAVDQTEDGTSVEELRSEFSYPNVDQQRDLRLWEAADGALIGFGQVWVPATGDEADGFLWFKAHPEHRDGTLESEILSWGEQRVREIGQERQIPAKLRAGARTDRPERIALLERHGFQIGRYFLRMRRSLDGPIPEPTLPDGFTLRHLSGQEEVPAWVDLFNESFIDHWNHHPLTIEERLHWASEPTYRLDQDLIATAPDGAFAAFCKCYISDEQNRRLGRSEGWISLLGSRRGYRNLGLGRAVLLAGLRRLQADGAESAVLGVDASSPTGATRLYESVGFETAFTSIAYYKDV
jgi:mycothiol synthase